ncbi:MAG: hypothetical protein LBI35_02565 [Burkholderiales bacterium]|jgi:hypothetical protein|nr:hypothetical protein [Burkholderiales bacterium]
MGATASPIITSSANLVTNIANVHSARSGAQYQAESAALSAQIQQNNWLAQANIAEHNARMMDFAKQTVYAQGQHEAARLGLQVGKVKGRQRAALGASGVDLGVGSAGEVQASTEVMRQIDVNTIETNAMLKAFGFENQVTHYRNQAAMARVTAEGYDPRLARRLSLLESAPSVARSWMGLSTALGDFGGAMSDWWKDEQKPAPVEDRTINYKKTGVLNPFPHLTAALNFNW